MNKMCEVEILSKIKMKINSVINFTIKEEIFLRQFNYLFFILLNNFKSDVKF